MKMSALLAEKCNSLSLSLSLPLSHFVNSVYSCFRIMYCVVSYCVLLCIMYVFNLLSVYQCVNKGYHT